MEKMEPLFTVVFRANIPEDSMEDPPRNQNRINLVTEQFH